jgi:hypothetical protein
MLKHGLSATVSARLMILGASLGMLGLAWVAGSPAQANVTLTRADIEAILNRVELIPQGRSARTARQRDVMAVGDTLRTAAQAQAQLRFNDGSLARVGERATFQFLPNTRNFRLSNGTMLLLIPPGRGRSTIQTPSAITGIQGSAVVVRHSEERNFTMVMALTNNPAGPMTVTIQGCGDNGAAETCVTEYDLYAGQMAIVQNNQVQILEFDLSTFYDTSPLTDGLDLNNPDSSVSLGPALDLVRAETLEALSQASDFTDAMVLNPAIVAISPNSQSAVSGSWLLSPAITETQVSGQVLPALPSSSASNPAAATQPLIVIPPVVAQPPAVSPPVTNPPVANPPVANPPVTNPPVANPPVTNPPVTNPPVTNPPVTNPPVTNPPVTNPPVANPPVANPPVANPPVTNPPVTNPPVTNPPVTNPPVTNPPVTNPPVTNPPVTNPPAANPPNRPTVPASPPPFQNNPTVPANPPARPPVIFQSDDVDD